jgi:hypothetical protein
MPSMMEMKRMTKHFCSTRQAYFQGRVQLIGKGQGDSGQSVGVVNLTLCAKRWFTGLRR